MPFTARQPSPELVDIVRALGGRWHGSYAMCRCPAHADTEPSLSLRQGHRDILVTCFAGCSAADVLSALRRLRHNPGSAPPTNFQRQSSGRPRQLWEQALLIRGTLGERYLRTRKLQSDLRDVRFHPQCPLGPKPKTVFKPALLVGVREVDRITAVQRIFLLPATADYEAKLILGQPGQGAWRGAEPAETLAIAEGFETAAAFSQLHNVPCWASLGARRLDQLLIPPREKILLLAEDNDAEGRRAALKALERYARPGLTIRREPPPARYGDWAEVLETEA